MKFTREHGKLLTVFIGILFGIYAITQILLDFSLTISVITLTFGMTAIAWTYMALSNLSKGTMLREYVIYFFFSLILIFTLSLWDLLIQLFGWQGNLSYMHSILLTAAYLLFFLAAYKILHLGKQFGFKSQVNKMKLNGKEKKIVKKNKQKK
jgi:hypothetical protein